MGASGFPCCNGRARSCLDLQLVTYGLDVTTKMGEMNNSSNVCARQTLELTTSDDLEAQMLIS